MQHVGMHLVMLVRAARSSGAALASELQSVCGVQQRSGARLAGGACAHVLQWLCRNLSTCREDVGR